MNRPMVSIVIETITARFDYANGSLLADIERSMNGIARQTYPADRIETIVVLDAAVSADLVARLRDQHPSVVFAFSNESNYFAAKNAGAAVASGEFIILLDGDCEPSDGWLETLLSRFGDDVGVVAGCTRYEGRSVSARTFSIPDFAYVIGEDGDAASGFNINNVAFRREVLIAHPFDSRIRRNGGCYFLFHELRAAGIAVVYEPRATVAHGLDIRGLGFVRKHFDRGHDSVDVYRLDDRDLLKGTRVFRRAGALGLIAIYVRRIALDFVRMFRYRRRIGVKAIALPYFGAIAVMTRLIELAGALTAAIAPRTSR